MTSYEPPDDPSEAPTGQYGFGERPGEPVPASTPWYRKPVPLIGLGVLVAALLALVILGITELTRHEGGSTPSSTSTTTPASVTTSSTAPSWSSMSPSSTTSTEPVAPAPTTSASTAPTTAVPTSTTIDEGRHHHHHHDGGTP